MLLSVMVIVVARGPKWVGRKKRPSMHEPPGGIELEVKPPLGAKDRQLGGLGVGLNAGAGLKSNDPLELLDVSRSTESDVVPPLWTVMSWPPPARPVCPRTQSEWSSRSAAVTPHRHLVQGRLQAPAQPSPSLPSSEHGKQTVVYASAPPSFRYPPRVRAGRNQT